MTPVSQCRAMKLTCDLALQWITFAVVKAADLLRVKSVIVYLKHCPE